MSHVEKMCYTWKNGSYLQKLVTLAKTAHPWKNGHAWKMGHICKNRSHFEELVTLETLSHTKQKRRNLMSCLYNPLIPYVLYSILLSCQSLVHIKGLLFMDFCFCYLVIYLLTLTVFLL